MRREDGVVLGELLPRVYLAVGLHAVAFRFSRGVNQRPKDLGTASCL